MVEDVGQDLYSWDDWWKGVSPLSEIRMWDFYGGRQWVSKYAPRFGKVLEAGCGVGRLVFLLRRFGIDIEGIDFLDSLVQKLNANKNDIVPDAVFKNGNILNLPYADNSLSGYISLGVVEHLIEGPQRALAEAFRVLRPGGIAIVTTPNISFLTLYRKYLKKIKRIVKTVLGRNITHSPFFQNEYTPGQLQDFLLQQGFHVSRAVGCDLLYLFCEIGGFTGENLRPGGFAYWFADHFENTFLSRLGAQSITISVKKAPLMYCFLSGELDATPDSLEIYDVPIAKKYQKTGLAELFLKSGMARYAAPYEIDPPLLQPSKRLCDYSGESYITDPIFEEFGFNRHVSPRLMVDPMINIELCVKNLKPIWRRRNASDG